MTLPDDYLKYPKRHHGMDQDLYPWSNMFDRPKVAWPNGSGVALWVTIAAEFFPLTPNDGPFKAPGHMATPFPDFRTYSTRDYGNRVGIYRIMKVLDEFGLKASVCLNSDVADRAPALVESFLERDYEIIAHGTNMNAIHYGGMDPATERQQIKDATDRLTATTGTAPKGWMSPGRSESDETPALLAEAGYAFQCDWLNDDMPYVMTTPKGELVAMPHTNELEDRKLLADFGQAPEMYPAQVLSALGRLTMESTTYGGRILHLALTPYIMGQPFRIRILKETLQHVLEAGGTWNATGADILSAWQESTPSSNRSS